MTTNRYGVSLRVMKCSKIDYGVGCATLNALKTIGLYTLSELYMNEISSCYETKSQGILITVE